MGKSFSALAYISTSGTAVAIGSSAIQLGGVIRGSDLAGTVILLDNAVKILTMSADRSLVFNPPIALRGPVTMTSSAGEKFIFMYRDV